MIAETMLARALCSAATKGEECASPYVMVDLVSRLKAQGHAVQLIKVRGIGLDADLRVDNVHVRIGPFSDGFHGAVADNKWTRWDARRTVQVSKEFVRTLPDNLAKGWMQHWPREFPHAEEADAPVTPVTFLSDSSAANAILFLIASASSSSE